jgi:hypothetical protein
VRVALETRQQVDDIGFGWSAHERYTWVERSLIPARPKISQARLGISHRTGLIAAMRSSSGQVYLAKPIWPSPPGEGVTFSHVLVKQIRHPEERLNGLLSTRREDPGIGRTIIPFGGVSHA